MIVDTISPSHRSWVMSRIKGRDTKPELAVRSKLHRLGFRFRLHRRDLPGRPDIVLARHGAIVCVHGCFWHRHRRCRLATTPKSRTDYWSAKFAANVARDRRNQAKLRRLGWRVLVVWECQVADDVRLQRILQRFFDAGGRR